MQIRINNRRIELAYKQAIAIQYDSGTEYVDFILDRSQYAEDLSVLTPLFLYENKAGGFIDSATKTIADDTITVRWQIGKHLTNVSGDLSFMLVLADCENIKDWRTATKIWQTEKITCQIPPSILATETFDPEAPLISQLIALAAKIDETIGNADQIIADMGKIKNDAQAIVDNFNAEDVVFVDGQTFQQKLDSGELDGPQGPPGEEGAGLGILGTLASAADLPATGGPGQAYIIGGDLYIWKLADNAWKNVGQLKGDPGADGHSPVLTIGDNGNWFIDGVDSGKGASSGNAYFVTVSEQIDFNAVRDGTVTEIVGTGTPYNFSDTTNFKKADTITLLVGYGIGLNCLEYMVVEAGSYDTAQAVCFLRNPPFPFVPNILITGFHGTSSNPVFSETIDLETVSLGSDMEKYLSLSMLPMLSGGGFMLNYITAEVYFIESLSMGKTSFTVIGAYLCTLKSEINPDTQYGDLSTTNKTLIGAINELQTAYTGDLTTFNNIMNGAGGAA